MHDAPVSIRPWPRLGFPTPTALSDARVQAHWALQLVGAAGTTHAAPQSDDSHTSARWVGVLDALVGQPLGKHPTVSVGVRIVDLTLLLVNARGDIADELELEGHTLDAAYDWLELAHSRYAGRPRVPLKRPGYDMPACSLTDGGIFLVEDHDALHELGRWFWVADHVLRDVQRVDQNASPVRCWPHHFDIATLITIEASDDPEQMKSVGAGMTPGDGSIAEPYFYVTPWPYPEQPELAKLPSGYWNTEGWLGAVLAGSELVSSGDARLQPAVAETFLNEAIRAAKKLVMP